MRIRRITISLAFAAGLATLPLSTAEAQSNPPQSNPPQSNPLAILSALLAVSTGMAVLRGGGRARYRRNNRHRADLAADGGTALRLLRAALLPTAALPTAALSPTTGVLPAAGVLPAVELFWATLSPRVSWRWHSGDRSGGEIVSG